LISDGFERVVGQKLGRSKSQRHVSEEQPMVDACDYSLWRYHTVSNVDI